MNISMKNFAQVIPGYTFREAITPSNNGNIYVLQAKNVVNNYNIADAQQLTKISLPTSRSASFVKHNDVILLSRGSGAGTFRACIYKGNNSDTLASSSVHIIRINQNYVLPEYLVLYLTSKQGQQELDQIASGTHFQIISRFHLAELQIPIPPIDKQQKLVDLYLNMKKQEAIATRKHQIYDNLLDATITQFQSV